MSNKPYYIFVEDRFNPIKAKTTEVEKRKNHTSLIGEARPGEYYTFQISIYSPDNDLENIDARLLDLSSQQYHIPSQLMSCFNLEGFDTNGDYFKKEISIEKGRQQVLWFGIQIPLEASNGAYKGTLQLLSNAQLIDTIHLNINIDGEPVEDFGDSELWKHSRLRWLNSTTAIDSSITKPFTPIGVNDDQLNILGRRIILNTEGFPQSIKSFFSETMNEMTDDSTDILNGPIKFNVKLEDETLTFNEHGYNFITEQDSKVEWVSTKIHELLELRCNSSLEYDGFMRYEIKVTAKEDASIQDIVMEIPFTKYSSRYAMGLGLKGGHAPDELEWKWNKNHQDALWLGNVNAGLQCKFKDENYDRPFVNVYYNQRPLAKPVSWANDGRGGIHLKKDETGSILRAYSGCRDMKIGETLTFVMEFLITPFKLIDYKKHWATRYDHPHENATTDKDWINQAVKNGANYTNIHHGHEMHPFINYPFIEVESLKAFIHDAHSKDLNVKLYYTLRELTNHIRELWAFYSLNGEIFPKPNDNAIESWQNRKNPWIEDNFGNEVIPAWQHVFNHGKYKGEICASILVNPSSRLNNYYIEGLKWLVDNLDINGLYIDDVAYDRHTMRRVRKILDTKPDSLIDMHSWNHMNSRAGFINCALLYMELFPYIDSLWFGERFDYDESPDYWLTEICGIPYGLMGQMLQDDGNPYRGMVYGMTNRCGWGKRNPIPIYNLWDGFGIDGSKMYGYWVSDCPVKTNHKDILATAYVKEDQVLVALASWADKKTICQLEPDWHSLGLVQDKVTITAPAIDGMQEKKVFKNGDPLSIAPGKGMLLLIK
ncbi:glycoside hydrolase domain-containing protein [Vallitalea okinawensis]|uniref:glycoside hydrolase domain-containing protein n=1 Tax=Vallitalea okinawensis TaxID=2078660 RepID=UPI000CFD9EEB|nr:glycoside hydrolase domain-containing protein [Vallitalea okinawensis]